ncbi:MAG: hypothetical protein ACYC27_07790 [Armatimonadota bacterium]
MKAIMLIPALIFITSSVLAVPQKAPVDEYPVHKDGGIIYNPLSREAQSTGQLAKYKNTPVLNKTLKLKQYNVQFAVPKKAVGYDVIPIKYKLSWTDGDAPFPLAVEATAFEDEKRRQRRDLFDLALPGKLDLKVEYLGSITAHLKPNGRHNMKADMSDTPKEYPPFTRKPMVRSGVVESGDLVWFKFKFTNTGDTILDPEGMGGCSFYPELYKKNAQGNFDFIGNPFNLYIRDLEYLYPGESHETWVHFRSSTNETPYNFGIAPGQYMIKMRMGYRWYKQFDPWVNMWDGTIMHTFEQPISVEAEARNVPVEEGKVTLTDSNEPDKITRWIHTFEEFMTAFDCHIEKPEGKHSVEGTLHLQVAPWTKHVVLKLIGTDPVSITSAAIPITVDTKSLNVKFDPDHQVTLVKNGMREPAIYSQTMADMRTNVQHGPFPEKHIIDRLREMMDCGINIICTTSMPWLYTDMHNPDANYEGDSLKYFLDLARHEGLAVEGWGTYPYDRSSIQEIYNWITGKNEKMDVFPTDGYPAVSHTDPKLPGANAVAWLYQFHRWGDLYYQAENGDVPFGVEDTRGWMRQDVDIRFPMGDATIKAFQRWAEDKYVKIETANIVWSSDYKSFSDVNPEANQKTNMFMHRWEYSDPNHPFHDWSPAVADLDQFRTELRVKNYLETFGEIRKEVPGATFLFRTEGGNVIVSGIDPMSKNTHMRHIYYSQRRCAAIAEILQKSGIVKYHSDYTTMPYTPSEIRMLTRAAVKQGIIPMYLPQFDNMRDIAINSKYGTEFKINYNLPESKKGAMMHVLTAVYPWFKATYEEGGTPGILWEDYQCDGFATETQKREMRFFKQKLNEAINTPAAKKQRSANIKKPSQEWRKLATPKKSYNLDESLLKR